MDSIHNILKVKKSDISKKVAGARRMARVHEAISWSSGTASNPTYHTIWSNGEYSIALAKPGKEAAHDYVFCRYKDGRKGNNPNDMRPSIFKNGELVQVHPKSFTEIFDELQILGRADMEALNLIACLFFRSAYMIDHVEVSPGGWRYEIPSEVLDAIMQKLPTADGLPMDVFLHFLDALAWNEDVKYHTLGYDVTDGYGRKNNLLTCVNLIGVLLNKIQLTKFAGAFSRPPVGLSPISNKNALYYFPELDGGE